IPTNLNSCAEAAALPAAIKTAMTFLQRRMPTLAYETADAVRIFSPGGGVNVSSRPRRERGALFFKDGGGTVRLRGTNGQALLETRLNRLREGAGVSRADQEASRGAQPDQAAAHRG